ncbi:MULTISPECIES: GNAT family N-acetyltransferase [Alicyclobacillus]|uniref:GNAT superfamily N-acetyltransferase n=1 Tax=Alicyclobacillus tolerans TaxID=90970 RepID=A0ABT9LYZ9_9BACL|nr:MULTISPECIES: GNAT family N-acetyltransferase [Alicyclobacillus]MDP9729366.1 GNAT superfamily N-acetyltransferase [Alicyclobacillus tengchongensis]
MLFLNHELASQIEDDMRQGNQQLVDAWRAADSNSTVQVLQLDGVLAVYGGPGCPVNEAVGLGMSHSIDGETLTQVEEFYESNRHPTVIRVCPLAHPSLIKTLQNRNYVLSSFAYRWVLDLQTWDPPHLHEVDPRVREATVDEEITWARTVAAGFIDAEDVPDGYDLGLYRAFFRMKSSIPVIAIDNGQPAAGGVIALNGEVAALFATSTRPSYRKHGLQTAMLDWRLHIAKEHGARIATIETDPDSNSQRNVERAGFRLAYVAVQMTRAYKHSEA